MSAYGHPNARGDWRLVSSKGWCRSNEGYAVVVEECEVPPGYRLTVRGRHLSDSLGEALELGERLLEVLGKYDTVSHSAESEDAAP